MTDEDSKKPGLPPVFQEPPDELDEEWTHGMLLVGAGQFPQWEWLEAARAYSETALRLVHEALNDGVRWNNGQPALFMCRHALELYLKAAIPDWKSLPGRNRHALAPLIDKLRRDLETRYRVSDVALLCDFLKHFSDMDPKATLFRFPDGSGGMIGEEAPVEVWVDFRALQSNLHIVLDALDRVCLEQMAATA